MDWLVELSNSPVLVAVVSLAASCLVAFFTTRGTLKVAAKTLEAERAAKTAELEAAKKKAEAEDLERIFLPAVTQVYLRDWLKDPRGESPYSFWHYLIDETKHSGLINELSNLLPTQQKAVVNPKALFNLICETLQTDYDLVLFMQRYNKAGNSTIVRLDVELLNKDIEFVNETLGKHYETYKTSSK
jgi:hypothetical protein